MEQALVVSHVILWFVVLVQGVVLFALARQLGILHLRIAPVGALVGSEAPRVGERGPQLEVKDLNGNLVRIGGSEGRRRDLLMMFVSPKCPVCKELLPAIKSLAKAERDRVEVVFVSDGGTVDDHRAFVRQYGLEAFSYVLSQAVGVAYQVGRLPYAVLLDPEGVVRSRGLVNTREHLESLLVARETGYATIQDYVRASAERSAKDGSAARAEVAQGT